MIDRIDSKSRKRVQVWPVALLRVYTGVFFAWHGFGKLSGGNFEDGMRGFLNSKLDSSYPFYRLFLESVVLPNSGLFATIIAWGELLVGLALIVGLATHYAAVAGALLVANFWFAKGEGILAGSNHDAIWLVIFVVLATVPAGKIAGLDDGLSDRMPFLR